MAYDCEIKHHSRSRPGHTHRTSVDKLPSFLEKILQ